MRYLFLLLAMLLPTATVSASKPVKVLMLTDYGNFWHDYEKQAEILSEQLPKFANIELSVVGKTSADTKEALRTKNFARGFDVLLYAACLADTDELDLMLELFRQVREENLPVVFLHCAMHNFRKTTSNPGLVGRLQQSRLQNKWQNEFPDIEFPVWWELNGVDSTTHAVGQKLSVVSTGQAHPITVGLAEVWQTEFDEPYISKEEKSDIQVLYESEKPFDSKKQPLAWVRYENDTKIFSTSLGHDAKTLENENFVKLLGRAILWLDDKLDDDGKILAGYEGFDVAYKNYSGSVVCEASEILEVSDKFQASQVVKKAHQLAQKLRAVSVDRSNSYSPIICPEKGGVLVQLRSMDKIIGYDKTSGVVRVEAGVRVSELNEYLAENYSVYLPAMPDYNGVSVAGGVATGAHHSSLNIAASMSDWVESVEIIDGRGIIKELSGDELRAARAHLGVLGIVTEISLRTRPLEKLRYEAIKVEGEDIAQEILSKVGSYSFARASWFPLRKKAVVETMQSVSLDTPGNSEHNLWTAATGLLKILGDLPNEVLNKSQALQCSAEKIRANLWQPPVKAVDSPNDAPVGYAHRMLASDCKKGECAWDQGLVNRTLEIAISLDRFSEWVKDVQAIIDARKACFPVLGIYLRFARSGDHMLAMNSQQDVFMFEIHVPTRPDKSAPEPSSNVYDEIQQLSLMKYDGRPHWAKNSRPIFSRIGNRQFKDWQKFVELQKELDPKGLFVNDFWKDLFADRAFEIPSYFGCVYDRSCICKVDSDCGSSRVCAQGAYFKPARVCLDK